MSTFGPSARGSASFNQQQEEFVKFIRQSAAQSKIGKVLFEAPAGTGKTFCIKSLYHELKTAYEVDIICPTHKSKTLFNNENAETIHKYFNQKMEISDHGERKFFDTNECFLCDYKFQNQRDKQLHIISCNEIKPRKAEHDFYKILFIDEASMVCVDMLNYINLTAISSLVILACDRNQIPPVNYPISPVFQVDTYIATFSLVKSMRAENDAIREFCDKFREAIQFHKNVPTHKVPVNSIIDAFKNEQDAVVISFTNAQKTHYNKYIRTALFQADKSGILDDFYNGETLVYSGFKNASRDYALFQFIGSDSENINYDYITSKTHKIYKELFEQIELDEVSAVFNSGSYINIQSIQNATITLGRKKINLYLITDTTGAIFITVKQQSSSDFKKFMSKWKADILKMHASERRLHWREWYTLNDFVNCELDYIYSITCHKSQGSAWDTVFVNIDNIRRAPDIGDRLAYTAVSRARKTLHFI